MVDSLRGIAANVGKAAPEYADAGAYVAGLGELPLARVVADDKVGDHHAIIPTDGPQDLSGIGPDERKIYDLVARRFLAAFHPPARKEVTSVDTEAGGHLFRSSGTVIVEPGFLAVYASQAPPEPRGELSRCQKTIFGMRDGPGRDRSCMTEKLCDQVEIALL